MYVPEDEEESIYCGVPLINAHPYMLHIIALTVSTISLNPEG